MRFLRQKPKASALWTPVNTRATQPLIGVLGVSDPANALRRAGIEPSWFNEDVAFRGENIAQDRSGRFIVCGDMILDNAAQLIRDFDLPPSSDAEICAELVLRLGADAGRAMLGMFAVAVWDTQRRELMLIRDAVGARTMYYTILGRDCWFSSQLRALRHAAPISDTLSLTALRDYLTCGFVPGDQTMWQDIREQKPGTVLALPSGIEHRYWEPIEELTAPDEPMDAAAARLRPLLEDSVQCCLPKSNPVGIFLSGGLDSSLVTAIAARQATGPVHTYAIHFGPEYPNELEFSSMVAAHCRTEHHILSLSTLAIREMLPETMQALDDPIGDPLTTPNLMLGRTAAQDVATILNGEGGDPCFGGPKNVPMLLHQLYGGDIGWEDAYFRSFQKCYDDLPQLLTAQVQRDLKSLPGSDAMLTPYLDATGMSSYLNRLMHINTRLKGSDQILTKVNNLTSHNHLLGRSPLFDRRIVEASFTIPAEHKLAGSDEKAVLKAAVADLLPCEILTRPKSGMLVPVQRWFRTDLHSYASHMLLSRKSRTRDYCNPALIREWLSYQGNLWPRHGVKLWLLLALEVWLRVQERSYEE